MKHHPKSYLTVVLLAACIGSSTIGSAQLVNPGFDDGPPGNVGNFGAVVAPTFLAGFWGAENSYIVGPVGNIVPRTTPYMLQMLDDNLVVTQAWQAVDVTGNPPQYAELRAWANSSSGATFRLRIHCFDSLYGWPGSIFVTSNEFYLDSLAHTWEQFSLGPLAIPENTQWIVAEIYFLNSSLDALGGFVDDVELLFMDVVATENMTLSSVKALFQQPR